MVLWFAHVTHHPYDIGASVGSTLMGKVLTTERKKLQNRQAFSSSGKDRNSTVSGRSIPLPLKAVKMGFKRTSNISRCFNF